MGLFSAISSIISSAVSFIGKVASAVGPAVSSFAKSTLSVMSKLPIPGLQVLNAISIASTIIHSVVKILGIKSEEDPEILGAKAAQCDKSIEEFDNDVEKYINYLTEEVRLDKEKFNSMSKEERLGCKTIGLALETKAVEEKMGGVVIPPESLATLTKIHEAGINIDAEKLVGTVKVLKEEGVTNLNDVSEFIEGKGNSDRVKTGEALVKALGDGAQAKILDIQDAARKYEEV